MMLGCGDKMKKFIMPNYEDSIVNLACSIRKYFGLKNNNKTLEDVDKLLEERKPRNVVVILYDGMGANLIKRILPNSFLAKKTVRKISSVAPATTIASTTSMLTGMYVFWEIKTSLRFNLRKLYMHYCRKRELTSSSGLQDFQTVPSVISFLIFLNF